MPSKWTSILIGALAYVFLSLLINVFAAGAGPAAGLLGCLVLIASAMVAVWHYTSTHQLTIPGGTGASMGTLVGIIGAIIGGLIGYTLIQMGVLPDPAVAAAEQMRERGMSREQIEEAQEMTEIFSSPIVFLLIGSVLGAIGGAIGGAVGAAMFKKGGPEPTEPGF